MSDLASDIELARYSWLDSGDYTSAAGLPTPESQFEPLRLLHTNQRNSPSADQEAGGLASADAQHLDHPEVL